MCGTGVRVRGEKNDASYLHGQRFLSSLSVPFLPPWPTRLPSADRTSGSCTGTQPQPKPRKLQQRESNTGSSLGATAGHTTRTQLRYTPTTAHTAPYLDSDVIAFTASWCVKNSTKPKPRCVPSNFRGIRTTFNCDRPIITSTDTHQHHRYGVATARYIHNATTPHAPHRTGSVHTWPNAPNSSFRSRFVASNARLRTTNLVDLASFGATTGVCFRVVSPPEPQVGTLSVTTREAGSVTTQLSSRHNTTRFAL